MHNHSNSLHYRVLSVVSRGVSEAGSAKTGSALNVCVDDVGSILKFRIGFSLRFSAMACQLRPSFVLGFGDIQAVDTEFPYQVPIVDGATIAAPLFAAPVSDSVQLFHVSDVSWLRAAPLLDSGAARLIVGASSA